MSKNINEQCERCETVTKDDLAGLFCPNIHCERYLVVLKPTPEVICLENFLLRYGRK